MEASAQDRGGERPAHPEDLELTRRTRSGDAVAVRRFLDRMLCVRRFLVHRNGRLGRPLGVDELEDVVQDTLLVLWRKLDAYRGDGALEAWAYRVSYLELLARLRELDRVPRLLEDVESGAREPQAPARRDALEFEHLYRQLERLGPPASDLVRQKCLDQLTFEEIAERMEVPVNTVKTRFYRALARLRTYVSGAPEPHVAEPDAAEPAQEVRR